MSSRPFWVTSTQQRSSNNTMKPRIKPDRYCKQALATILLAWTGTIGAQTSVGKASGGAPPPAASAAASQNIVESAHTGAGAPQQTHLSLVPKASGLTPASDAGTKSQQQPPVSGASKASEPASVPEKTTLAPVVGSNDEKAQVLHVVLGRSVFINTPERLRRIYVSNPTVIDSMTPTPHELVITAKLAGTSSLVLWNEEGQSSVYTVLSDVDVGGLRESLSEALPGDQIAVEAQGPKVFLTGVVGSDAAAEQAAKLAAVYSKEVLNSLVVDPRHRPQVQLKVRFAELDRSKLTQWGVNLLSTGNNSGASTTGQFAPPTFPQVGGGRASALISDVLNLFYFNVPNGVGLTIKDLQTKGILEILAEPNLMTIDGVPARFLAGGEFPYPVIQPGSGGGTATVTIQFKPYGVKLEFTPYVAADGSIRLKVAPEVSALDYSNVVIIAGYTLPSISTRKAETEIELRDGQTFGISGILDHRTTDNLSKMPGIGDVPVLGHLFRSKNLNSSVTELIVVVTPTIVDPLSSPDNSAPPDPGWLVPPGQLGNFTQGLPKSYEKP